MYSTFKGSLITEWRITLKLDVETPSHNFISSAVLDSGYLTAASCFTLQLCGTTSILCWITGSSSPPSKHPNGCWTTCKAVLWCWSSGVFRVRKETEMTTTAQFQHEIIFTRTYSKLAEHAGRCCQSYEQLSLQKRKDCLVNHNFLQYFEDNLMRFLARLPVASPTGLIDWMEFSFMLHSQVFTTNVQI